MVVNAMLPGHFPGSIAFLLPGISVVWRALGDGPVHGVELIGETLEKMNIKTR
jgi:hypothetical protein